MPSSPAAQQPILVIDDDELSRELLLLMLEFEGHATHSFPSGDFALAALRSHALPVPAVILSDLQMPGLTGDPLARELQTICGPDTLLIAISATPPAPESISAFHGFLQKPFTAAQLAAALAHPSPISAPPSEPSPTDTPVLDEKTFALLGASMQPTQLRQLYALSLQDTASRIARMQAAAQAGDATVYTHEAHGIKGGAGLLGASEISSLAAAIEAGGLSTTALLEQISSAAARLQRMLESRF